jgi:hypothetical protein
MKQIYNYHKDVDCRSLVSGCPNLNIGKETMTQRIRLITCNALHVVLPFKSKQVTGSIEEIIEIIETPWECPLLVQKRKAGELPAVQMSIK